MNHDITISPAQKSDADFIATIVMGALGSELCLGLAGSEDRLDVVHTLFRYLGAADHSQYSYTNTLIARSNGRAVGGIIAYDGARLHDLRKEFVHAANDILGWQMTEEDFGNRGDETGPGEIYIDSLYVSPEYRGKGIASKLISNVALLKATPDLPTIGLLVEFENERAKRLYESIGFKTVGVNNFFPVPMHHMQKIVNFS
ncbi:MAG: GNAT family N-acetyltransferase [Bacteroidales bacterium]|nr:GNAT family N-acetyltransferase [Bacteroidales bacterium]